MMKILIVFWFFLLVNSIGAAERYIGWQVGLGENNEANNTLKESLQIHSYGYDSANIKTFWGYRYLKHQSIDQEQTVRTYGIEAGFRWQPAFKYVKPWIGLSAITARSRQCFEMDNTCVNDDRFWLEPSAGVTFELASVSLSAYRQRLIPLGGESAGMFDIPTENISSIMFSARF